ncbi:MAG: phage shock protein A, partial [Gemmatimonadales bacterium]|nr:phage shock protein A [Gemmatimonadales bacterium]
MGIFRRVSDILTANVNDLLDRAENPEKMIKQVIREMEEAVQGARRNVAQVMANQKKL